MKKLKVTIGLLAFFMIAGILSSEKNQIFPAANAVKITVPGMDEFTQKCMATSEIEVTVGQISGEGVATGSYKSKRVAGTEISCEMAWAVCSRYSDCVANISH